jgi:hypothetical protein
LVKNKTISRIEKAVFTGSLLCVSLLFAVSCGNKDPKIVRVEDVTLTESELLYRMETAGETDDSQEGIINEWLKQAAILNQFDSLPEEIRQQINFKLLDYKASLIRYELENMLIEQLLDTMVTEEEMLAYYNENKRDFELSDFIVKVLYLKVPSNAPDLQKVTNWYLLRNPKDTAQILAYANVYSANFFYNKEKWIYFDDILKEIPLEGIDKEKFILNKTKTYFEDNGFMYYLNILDYRLKNAPSPFSLEREHVRQRLLTARIRELREVIQHKIIDKALEQYEIRYYTR